MAALRAVHKEFKLHEAPASENSNGDSAAANKNGSAGTTVTPQEVIDRLAGVEMEGLTIDDISLDDAQSRITLAMIPNKAGLAATVFERLAKEEIFVDMIVQSFSDPEATDISYTVPRAQFEKAVKVSREISDDVNCSDIDAKREIAKLTVQGIGLRSHTGVATAMFEMLAEGGINLEMINTSEVRVNVVVDGVAGESALSRLRQGFQI